MGEYDTKDKVLKKIEACVTGDEQNFITHQRQTVEKVKTNDA